VIGMDECVGCWRRKSVKVNGNAFYDGNGVG